MPDDGEAPAPVGRAEPVTPVGRLRGARVAVVGINYAPETTGIAPYTTAMARALADAGAEVTVITGVPHYPAWAVEDPRYRDGRRWDEVLDGIPVTRVRHHVPRDAGVVGRAGMELSFLLRAGREVRRSPAQVLVAVTPSLGGLAAAVLGARGRPVGAVVQDLTGLGASESGSSGTSVAGAVAAAEYALLRRADRVGVITPRFGEVLGEHGIDEGRVVVVPNFTHIDGPRLDRAAARRALGWPDGVLRVVHTGNIGMKQGLEGVVEAARHADALELPLEFVLVGDGNQREAVMSRAAGTSRLVMMRPVDAEQYPVVLAAADVLLVHERPGVREMSLPSKITSYAVSGRPILAACEPGGISHRVLSDAGAALVVQSGDPAALVDGALRIGGSQELGDALVAAARRLAREQYGAAAAAARYTGLVEALIG